MEYTKINFSLLEQYRTFDSLKEMDNNIYIHMDLLIKANVPSSVVEVLRFFGRSSIRICGVSFAKYQTIADALKISKRTVLRAVKTLGDLGIIDRIPTLKKWRRSVNVIRILPLSPQDVTATKSLEDNDVTALNGEMNSEALSFNHLKQELHNQYSDSHSMIEKVSKLSTNIDLDGNLKNIVRYLTLKVGDKIKNGLQIDSFSSYCEKLLANEIKQAAFIQAAEQRKKAKEDEELQRFESFVQQYYGTSFEDLGAFSQSEVIREYTESMKTPKVAFYNWLEA